MLVHLAPPLELSLPEHFRLASGPALKLFTRTGGFELAYGGELQNLRLGYHTYGELNAARDNAIWVCHALTANSDPADWWAGLVGPGCPLDPARYFIVCVNMLGSCYGSTGPLDTNPANGEPWYAAFPTVTPADMVRAQVHLADALGIARIHLVIGGSMGGQQALEWAVQFPGRVEHLVALATNAQHSAWGIAFNESQRMALEADPTYRTATPHGGRAGLAAARSIAMLSYRSYPIFQQTQHGTWPDRPGTFRAATYQRYQGEKLVRRFSAHSYHVLSRAMDAHGFETAPQDLPAKLGRITAKTLVIGIRSDVLFPVEEQQYLAAHIPCARYVEIDSDYGHDGFLVETERVGEHVTAFMYG